MNQEVQTTETGTTTKKEPRPTHLKYVDTLPDDVRSITNYNNHNFNNLYVSPSTKCLYQQYPNRIRLIEPKRKNSTVFFVRTPEKITAYISRKKLFKMFEID